jgi:4-hydroxymandelate oxidase
MPVIPQDIAAVADYEPYARQRLDAAIWASIAGGSADEHTLAENRVAFARIRLNNRVLADLSGAHTRLDLLGQSLDHPILLAPTAWHRLLHPEGEMATVTGASAMRAAMVVSAMASLPLEALAKRAVSPLWFQLYVQPDRAFTHALVKRAEDAGYRAQPPPPPQFASHESEVFKGLLAGAPTWADIATLRAQTKLPMLLKGIMTAADALRAIEVGADAVIVSNHGGRTLDTQPASIDALPRIAAAVQGRVPLLLDGGIRRGTDVVKALALGARAVLVGRPVLHGLAVGGATGVAHVLKLLRTELEIAMAQTGCATLDAIGPDVIWQP